MAVHGQREMRGAQRWWLVRRRGSRRTVESLPRRRREESRDPEHPRYGAVVARRMGARHRRQSRQPELRRPHLGVFPGDHPVFFFHAAPERQTGVDAGGLAVLDGVERVPAPRRVAAEESAADDPLFR